MMHPADRIRKAPMQKMTTNFSEGLPFVITKKVLKVGHIRRKVPIGLSNLINFFNPIILFFINISGFFMFVVVTLVEV